jgi:hypothetical protein
VSDPGVRLAIRNRSEHAISLVIEPVGEIYPMEPGQTRVVRYVGDPTPNLAIEIGDAETKIWEEGVGTLEVEA